MIIPNTIYINGRFLTQAFSGVQRHAFELSRQLSLFDKYNFILLVPSKLSIRGEYDFSFNIKKIGNNKGHLWEQVDLPRYLKKKNNPLLINLTNSAPIFYKNKVSTIHDLSVFENSNWFSFKYRSFYRFLIPRIIKTSKKILTDSYFIKGEIIKNYQYSSKKIYVVHCATSLNIIDNINNDITEDYLLFIGGSSKRKNLKNLIDAFIRLDDKNINLKIVGAKVNHVLLDAVSEHASIEYIGDVSNNQLINLYSNAKILIFPSFYEGFGLPPLEAMSCKCPVILSDIPVLKELYEDAALYINPHDIKDIENMILKLLNDNQLRNDLIQRGLDQSKKYSWKKSANKIISLIKEISR